MKLNKKSADDDEEEDQYNEDDPDFERKQDGDGND